jgi:uncharacterized protein (TIGR00369 family)
LNTDTTPDLDALRRILASVVAPWVAELDLQLRASRLGEVELAAADTAMILAVCTHLGGFKPMTTVQLQTSFLRPIAADAGECRVVARVLRMGRKLVFGEVLMHDAQGQLAAHATTTYSLL